MRIRTGPDFQIQCIILYGKWQNPDCAVRIAVKRALDLSYEIQPNAADTLALLQQLATPYKKPGSS